MSKVHILPNGSLPGPGVEPGVVSMLEEALALARQGKISGVALALTGEGRTRTRWCSVNTVQNLGAAQVLVMDMYRALDRDSH